MTQFLQPYVTYLREITKLEMFHVFDLSRRPQPVAPAFALAQYTGLWARTVFHDGGSTPADADFAHPEWDHFKAELSRLFQEHAADAGSAALEEAALAYLLPFMAPCAYRNSRPPRKGPERPYGGWSCYIRNGQQVSIHIANVYRPDSPFDHIEDWTGDLLRLLVDIAADHPETDTLFCGSWLNNLPVFRALFPPAWTGSLADPCRYNGSIGIWGQYTARDGGFHEKNAASLRQTGEHPYPLIHASCPLDAAIEFLHNQEWKKPLYILKQERKP
jgi:hypothetical protein